MQLNPKPKTLTGQPGMPLVEPSRWLACGRGVRSIWGRWSEWAESLAERRLPGEARIAPPWLLHLRPVLRNNWIVQTNAYYPQIKLTIQPFLRAGLSGRADRQSLLIARQSLPGVSTTTVRDVTGTQSTGGEGLRFGTVEPRAHPPAPVALVVPATGSRSSAHSHTESPWSRRAGLMSPLEIVFRRAAIGDGERPTAQRRSFEYATEIVERIARATRRVEETRMTNSRLAVAYPTRRNPALISSTDVAGVAQPSVRPFGTAASQTAMRDAMPPVSVEQLADRVLRELDRKIVATRERMGKSC
jgi:hypothetical protein